MPHSEVKKKNQYTGGSHKQAHTYSTYMSWCIKNFKYNVQLVMKNLFTSSVKQLSGPICKEYYRTVTPHLPLYVIS